MLTQKLCKAATFDAQKKKKKRTVSDVMLYCSYSALVEERTYYRPKAFKPIVLAVGQEERATDGD